MFVRHESAYGRSEKKETLFCEVGFLYELALFANAIFVFAYQSFTCDFATRLGDFSSLLLSRYSLRNNAPGSSQPFSPEITLFVGFGESLLYLAVIAHCDPDRNTDRQTTSLNRVGQSLLAVLNETNNAVNIAAVKSEFPGDFIGFIAPLPKVPNFSDELPIRRWAPSDIFNQTHQEPFFPRRIAQHRGNCGLTQSTAGLHPALTADEIIPSAICVEFATRYRNRLLQPDLSDAGDDLLKLCLIPCPRINNPDFSDWNVFDFTFVQGISSIRVRRAMLKKKSKFSKR